MLPSTAPRGPRTFCPKLECTEIQYCRYSTSSSTWIGYVVVVHATDSKPSAAGASFPLLLARICP